MPSITDLWGTTVDLTPSYISYRNRLIDVHLINTFQVKGKRLYINTYKQNTSVPTMCIFFETKEKALEAFEIMKSTYYDQTSDIRSDVIKAVGLVCLVIPVILGILLASK
jgi:hypothetical protein